MQFFGGNSLYQATKRHLNKQINGQKRRKMKEKDLSSCFGLVLQLVRCMEDCWRDNDV